MCQIRRNRTPHCLPLRGSNIYVYVILSCIGWRRGFDPVKLVWAPTIINITITHKTVHQFSLTNLTCVATYELATCNFTILLLVMVLTFITLYVNSADDTLMILFFFFSNRFWHFIQIVSCGDNLHEMAKPVFWKKIRQIFQYVVCWKSYPECYALNPHTVSIPVTASCFNCYLN